MTSRYEEDWRLNEASFEETMVEIAETALGIGQCRIQLIHWYRPAIAARRAAT